MEKAQILELAANIGKEVKESALMKAYEKAAFLFFSIMTYFFLKKFLINTFCYLTNPRLFLLS